MVILEIGKPQMRGGGNVLCEFGEGGETYYRLSIERPSKIRRAQKVGLVSSVPVPSKENERA